MDEIQFFQWYLPLAAHDCQSWCPACCSSQLILVVFQLSWMILSVYIIGGYQSAKINNSTRMVYNTKRRTCKWHSPLDFSEAGDAKKMCCFVGEFGSLSLVMTQDEALHRAPEKLKICYLFSILGIEFNIFNPVAAFTRFVETRLMAAVCLARCGQLPMIAFKTKASVANGIATAFLPSWRLPMTGPQAAKDS